MCSSKEQILDMYASEKSRTSPCGMRMLCLSARALYDPCSPLQFLVNWLPNCPSSGSLPNKHLLGNCAPPGTFLPHDCKATSDRACDYRVPSSRLLTNQDLVCMCTEREQRLRCLGLEATFHRCNGARRNFLINME